MAQLTGTKRTRNCIIILDEDSQPARAVVPRTNNAEDQAAHDLYQCLFTEVKKLRDLAEIGRALFDSRVRPVGMPDDAVGDKSAVCHSIVDKVRWYYHAETSSQPESAESLTDAFTHAEAQARRIAAAIQLRLDENRLNRTQLRALAKTKPEWIRRIFPVRGFLQAYPHVRVLGYPTLMDHPKFNGLPYCSDGSAMFAARMQGDKLVLAGSVSYYVSGVIQKVLDLHAYDVFMPFVRRFLLDGDSEFRQCLHLDVAKIALAYLENTSFLL